MRILTVLGTRPEAIKLAPVILAFQNCEEIEHFTCITGQHREMLYPILQTFSITPDFDLGLMQPNQDLTHITSASLQGVGSVLSKINPDWLVVQGDTTSAFAAALASFYHKVKVVHVEAGLRTGSVSSPWPEEMNRRLVSQLAAVHFPPTARAQHNLLIEGVCAENVLVTGNTVIDALHWVCQKLDNEVEFLSSACAQLPALCPDRKMILVTGHRRDNLDGGIARVCCALKILAERPDVEIVYPVHLNPRVQKPVNEILRNTPWVHLIPPLSYVPFVALMRQSYLIITDSGGIQEEAPGLGKPVVVIRDSTERPEAIEAGTAQLAGTDMDNIISIVSRLLDSKLIYDQMAQAKNPFGDGEAATRIVEFLLQKRY